MINELQNLEAEQSILSQIISNNNKIYSIELNEQDFYNVSNSLVFSSISSLIDKNSKADLVTISQDLESKKQLKRVGGRSYLAEIVSAYGNLNDCVGIVKDNSIRRQLLLAQEQNEKSIYNKEEEIENVLAVTQDNIFKVSNCKKQDDGVRKIIDELYDVRAEYAQKYEQGQKYLGTRTGFEKIDNIIDGLRAGHLWVVGGWTSTGKTMFSLNIVNSVLEQDVPTSIFSLEMSKVDLLARLVGIRTNLSSMKIIKGKQSKEVSNLIEGELDALHKKPLEIHNTYYDLDKIKMMIRKDVYIRRVKFVVVDYIQNVQSTKYTKEYEIISKAMIELYSLALELGITILVVSQVSNEAEKGQGAGAGFKGSGTIEAVADLAIRLKRDRKEESDDDTCVPIEIIVTKNRHGFTGKIKDYFMYLKSGLYHPSPSLEDGIKNKIDF